VRLFDALEAEWKTLPYLRHHRRTYRTWRTAKPELAEFDDAAALIENIRRQPPAAADQSLAALAKVAADDDFAARTMLQALTPGLRKLATTHLWLAPRPDLEATIVAIAWEHIRRYPVERRPRRVAANILLDTAHHLRREAPQRRCIPAPCDVADTDLASPIDELTEVVLDLVAAGQLHPHQAAIILDSRNIGWTPTEIASHLGCSVPAARERRRRAELALEAAGRALVQSSTTDRY
jgi:DNA-directed RNA polymerase specialized sigma24 family protein